MKEGITKPQLGWILVGERLDAGFLLYDELLDDTPPLSALVFMGIDWMFGRTAFVYELLGRLLILLQVYVWTNMLIRYRVFEENTYLPAIILFSLFHLSFDMLSLSPALLGSTFLLLVLSQLFSQTVLQKESSEATLLIGLYGGLAACFQWSYFLFLPFLLVVAAAISGFTIRQLLLTLLGFLLPFGLILLYYFWKDGLDSLLRILPLILGTEAIRYQPLLSIVFLMIFPGILALTGFFISSLSASSTINQQKQRQIMLFWIAFALISLLFTQQKASYQLVLLLPVLSYFITLVFLRVRKKILLDSLLYLFILGMPLATLFFFSNQESIQKNYRISKNNEETWSEKSLMILGEDFAPYLTHPLGGPFLNYSLAQSYFEQEKSLSQRARFFRLIHSQKPQLILDPNGDFARLLDYYPELRRNYTLREPGVFEWTRD